MVLKSELSVTKVTFESSKFGSEVTFSGVPFPFWLITATAQSALYERCSVDTVRTSGPYARVPTVRLERHEDGWHPYGNWGISAEVTEFVCDWLRQEVFKYTDIK